MNKYVLGDGVGRREEEEESRKNASQSKEANVREVTREKVRGVERWWCPG